MTTLLFLATISIWRMGGDIRIDDAPNGASLHTMGGNIRITRAAGEVVAKTMGGNIDIRSLEGSIEATTMGGRIRVNVDGNGPGRNLELQSYGGEVELTLPADFSGEFTIELEESESPHEIISDFPLNVKQSTRTRLFSSHDVQTATGRAGTGANRVRITTAGSDIIIRKK